jgi:hypothetical protein
MTEATDGKQSTLSKKSTGSQVSNACYDAPEEGTGDECNAGQSGLD